MHQVDVDFTLDRITKVEGSAGLDIRVRGGKVEYARFKVQDYKRFYTTAMIGKPLIALPQLLARICGTCSNAHLLCSIEACENVLGIKPTVQTILLRTLTMYGLNIRDHALHLYLFALPDIYEKDSLLAFDEQDSEQHQLLHDAFDVKAAGNHLAMLVAGRSVHALHPTVGGSVHFPDAAGIAASITELERIRPAVVRLVEVFDRCVFKLDRQTHYLAMIPERYGFLNGEVMTSRGEHMTEDQYGDCLERIALPYTQASAYTHAGTSYMVGALARMNLAQERLHPKTRETARDALAKFPSTNIFHNNLAQAIELLHAVDDALEILRTTTFAPESIQKMPSRAATGIGVVEAPRGTLYHKITTDDRGIVTSGAVIVPTGQNQSNIEADIACLVEDLVGKDSPRERIEFELEKLIRAYDPCMSCAAHFLKVKWE